MKYIRQIGELTETFEGTHEEIAEITTDIAVRENGNFDVLYMNGEKVYLNNRKEKAESVDQLEELKASSNGRRNMCEYNKKTNEEKLTLDEFHYLLQELYVFADGLSSNTVKDIFMGIMKEYNENE